MNNSTLSPASKAGAHQHLTREVARLVVASRLEDFPAHVLHEGRRSLLNWIGCAVGGSDDATTDSSLAVADEFSGPRKATVLGRHEKLDALSAAFVNGVSSAVNAFDDTHLPTVTHPTGPVAAALLALGETRTLSGRDLLHALILGMEIECRLSNVLIAPPAQGDERWLMTGLTGTIGAAVAAGKVLNLNEDQLVWTIGTAVLQASGVREGHATMGHSFSIGHAARCGLFAALLGDRGFTGAEHAIEGPRGFAHLHAARPALGALTADWGDRYEMLLNAFKPYPCGIVAHAAIDAALDALRGTPFAHTAINKILIDVHPLAIELTGRPAPTTSFDVPYSLQHWVASALIKGEPGLEDRTDAAINNPSLVALRAKVEPRAEPNFERDEAAICILLNDGTQVTAHVRHARGSAARPLTDAELENKFCRQADQRIGRTASLATMQGCWRIEQLEDSCAIPRAAAQAPAIAAQRAFAEI